MLCVYGLYDAYNYYGAVRQIVKIPANMQMPPRHGFPKQLNPANEYRPQFAL